MVWDSYLKYSSQALHWVDFVMATGSFSSHWISYLYLNFKCSSLKSHFGVINENIQVNNEQKKIRKMNKCRWLQQLMLLSCKIYCMQMIPRKKKRITASGLKFPRSMNLNLSVRKCCFVNYENAMHNKISQKNLLISHFFKTILHTFFFFW